jgi:hypothetical protein
LPSPHRSTATVAQSVQHVDRGHASRCRSSGAAMAASSSVAAARIYVCTTCTWVRHYTLHVVAPALHHGKKGLRLRLQHGPATGQPNAFVSHDPTRAGNAKASERTKRIGIPAQRNPNQPLKFSAAPPPWLLRVGQPAAASAAFGCTLFCSR